MPAYIVLFIGVVLLGVAGGLALIFDNMRLYDPDAGRWRFSGSFLLVVVGLGFLVLGIVLAATG